MPEATAGVATSGLAAKKRSNLRRALRGSMSDDSLSSFGGSRRYLPSGRRHQTEIMGCPFGCEPAGSRAVQCVYRALGTAALPVLAFLVTRVGTVATAV